MVNWFLEENIGSSGAARGDFRGILGSNSTKPSFLTVLVVLSVLARDYSAPRRFKVSKLLVTLLAHEKSLRMIPEFCMALSFRLA